VKFRHQQPPGFFQVKVLEFPDVLSEDGNANAQESISFAVFSFSGFKKPLIRQAGSAEAFAGSATTGREQYKRTIHFILTLPLLLGFQNQ
jgi:hypothetical protein